MRRRCRCVLKPRKSPWLFPPVRGVSHGLASRTVLSGCGRVLLRRRRWAKAAGPTATPVDALLDAAQQSVSLAVREMCCRVGIDSGSFGRAAASLERVGQLRLSDELLRQIVETEGQAVLAWQEQGQLELDFDAGACRTDATADHTPVTRVYVGIDGFMLPMVSDGEVQKRHAKAQARRKGLPRRRGVRRPKLVPRQGADQRYKEFKLAVLYDQDLEHKLLRVTRRGPDHAGRMLGMMAEDVQLCRARQIVALTDGAEWISRLVETRLPAAKTTAILDFYHASEHVHEARRRIYGEDSTDGWTWANAIVGGMLERNFADWWELVVQTRARLRAPAKRQALDQLMGYLLPRREKLAYARFRALGLKIGSGPTESACKSQARRLKGVGMRWTPQRAEAMLALEALHQSDLWTTYWQSITQAAA
jgi:hypothetical protein